MTDRAAPPTDPTTPPPARPSRRRLFIVIAIAVVVGVATYIGVQFALRALDNAVTQSQSEAVDEPEKSEATEPYVSETDGFTVTGPGTPERSESTQTVEGIEITQTQTVWTDGSSSFIVGAAEFPDISGTPIDEVLDGSVSGMSDAISGSTVRTSEKTTVHGEPAVAGVVDIEGSPSYHFLIVLHNGWQYVLLVSELDDSRDEDFIASFDFTS